MFRWLMIKFSKFPEQKLAWKDPQIHRHNANRIHTHKNVCPANQQCIDNVVLKHKKDVLHQPLSNI